MHFEVSADDTATAMGSGDVAVLATPRLIAWLEAATLSAAKPHVSAEQTTVGTAVRIQHRRPSAIGERIEVQAEPPVALAEKRLTFTVHANDSAGNVVASGEIDRAIVERDFFVGSA